MEHPSCLGDTLVRTEGLYLCLLDRESPVAGGIRIDEILGPPETSPDDDPTILRLNSHLVGLSREQQLLTWVLLQDGVFKVRCYLAPPAAELAALGMQRARFTGGFATGTLSLPSGDVLVTSLGLMGAELQPAFQVPPGDYEVELYEDREQHSRHNFLREVEDYPPDDGPDWVIVLHPTPA